MKKRLYKDHSEAKIFGVCSGVAKFLNTDPTLIRLGLALFCLLGGSGILAYIVCAIIIPDEPGYVDPDDDED